MGATLPLMVDAAGRGPEIRRQATGRLYGANTLGAVAGVIAAELVLLRWFGVTGSAWMAAGLSVGAAVSALVLEWMLDAGPPRMTPLQLLERTPVDRGLVAASALSGALFLALEIVWFRVLALSVVASTLTSSVMLAVVLAGIGVGAAVAGAWARAGDHAVLRLPWLAIAAAAASWTGYAMFNWLVPATAIADLGVLLSWTAVIALPTALLSGGLFALIGTAVHGEGGLHASPIGVMFAANTMGAACGALAAAFVLLPAFGMSLSLALLSSCYVAVAWLMASRLGVAASRRFRTAALAAAVLTAGGAWRAESTDASYVARTTAGYMADGSSILASADGPSETSVLLGRLWMGEPLHHRLVTNGFSCPAHMSRRSATCATSSTCRCSCIPSRSTECW